MRLSVYKGAGGCGARIQKPSPESLDRGNTRTGPTLALGQKHGYLLLKMAEMRLPTRLLPERRGWETAVEIWPQTHRWASVNWSCDRIQQVETRETAVALAEKERREEGISQLTFGATFS